MALVTRETFSLSTEGYTFYYRPDTNDRNIKRCILLKNGVEVNNLRVSAGYGKPEKSHQDVINHFEAEISLGYY